MPSYIEHVTSTQALTLLEDAGADPFLQDKYGEGLLHVATRPKSTVSEDRTLCRNFKDILRHAQRVAAKFELLVSKGLDVAMEDEQKRNTLDAAIAHHSQGVLKLFDKDNVRKKLKAADLQGEIEAEHESDDIGF